MSNKSSQGSNNYMHYLKQQSFNLQSDEPSGILLQDGLQVQIDQREYGVLRTIPIYSVQFNPREMGIIERYQDNKCLYHEMISSTKIFLSKDLINEQNVIKKSIQKDRLVNPLAQKFAKNECMIHSQMVHENIVELYDYTETKDEYVLYMEYCDNASYLSSKILDSHTPIKNNDKMVSYAQDILEGLKYIHTSGVIHDDIKPENLLMQTSEREDEYSKVKICDFGLSQIVDPSSSKVEVEAKCGTLGYIAPEVQEKQMIGTEIDMWSLGIVLYEMAVAYKPTCVSSYRYGSGPLPFRRVDWKKKGQHLQDLIKSCLEINPSKRISAEDALQHPWFSEEVLAE